MPNSRLRHLRRGIYDRVRRSRKLLAFLAQEAADLAGTGAAQTFTAAGGGSSILTATSHGFAVGDGPFYVSSDTTLPSGLIAGQPYWIHGVLGANTFDLTGRRGDPDPVDCADAGTGIHTITKGDDQEAVYNYLKTNHPETVKAAVDADAL